jgi:nicotinamide mononucleotide transporter
MFNDWLAMLAIAWAGLSAAEAAGAALGVVYVVLAILQHRACWVAAILSTAIYLAVFYRAGLYMQAALQGYYIAVAVYGWWRWGVGGGGKPLPVTRASWTLQLGGLTAVLAVSLLTARWLAHETGSTQPFLDSITTWASVFATWLVAQKKIENWAWWFGIDLLTALLCWRAHLYPSTLLYALYVALVLVGWRAWSAGLSQDRTPAPS